MNYRNEKRKLRRGLRVLELIDQGNEQVEMLESSLKMAEYNGFTTMANNLIEKIESKQAAIERLKRRYEESFNK